MAGASFLKKSNGIDKKLNDMVKRSRDVRSYLNTVVVEQYRKAQIKRWMTENSSEGVQWADLNPKYEAWKAREFASYPGGGRAKMIATGRLVNAATLREPGDAFKIVTQTSITIGIDSSQIEYARWVAKKRPIMRFSRATIAEMRAGIKSFIKKGTLTWRAG